MILPILMQNKTNLKLFKSKKFFLSLGGIVLLSGLLGFFVIRQQSKLPDIFSYIPNNIDQAMINWPERNIKNNSNPLVSIPEGVQQQFKSIKVMIIGQNIEYSGQQMVFLQTKSDFNPQDFLATLNPETDTLYTYLRFDNGLYLFAPKALIQKYKKPNNQDSFFSQPDIKGFTKTIRSNSLTMITNNLGNLLGQEYSSLSKNVKYVIVSILSENKNQIKFTSYLVFNKPYTITKQSFKPLFKSYLKESTIGYVEFGDLINILDIDLSSLLSQTTGDVQAFGQIQFLNNIFKNHVAVILSKGNNALNLGLTILSKDKNLYAQLQPLMPLLDAQLSKNFPFLSGAILEQIDGGTRLSIGNPIIEGKSDGKLSYDKNSLAVAKIDVGQISSLYKQFLNVAEVDSDIVNNEAFLDQMENKILWANISIDSKKVSLEGELK